MKRVWRPFSAWEIRTKLTAALVWLVGLLLLRRIASVWILFAIAMLLICADGGISTKKAFRQLLHVLPFVLLMLITLSLSGGIPLKHDAVAFALLLCSRVMAAAAVVMALVGGRESDDFIRSLAVLPLPPVYLSLLFLVNRYVHLLIGEFRQQTMALRSRMFVPKAGFSALRNIGYVVGGMFIRGYDRSEHVYDAMKARCYAGVIPYDDAPVPGWSDWLMLCLAVLSAAALILLERLV